jgi:aspartate racemase
MSELERPGVADMAEALRDEVLARGYRRVILLGTEHDMGDPQLKAPLAKAGVLVLVPGPADRAWIGSVIASELRQGCLTAETVARFTRLLADGAEHGVDAVAVTCLELLELYARTGLALPAIDVARLGANNEEARS